MTGAEESRGNRAKADKRTPNESREVVKEGFLEERTPDLNFGRGQENKE